MFDPKTLSEQKCVHGLKSDAALNAEQIESGLKELNSWQVKENTLTKTFRFDSYYQMIVFVNAVAWIAQQQNHHPNVSFDFKTCTVAYWTHSAQGLTANDFICAARVDNLY